MITVAIMINGHPIYTRSAVNKSPRDVQGKNKYRCDDGTIIHHLPKDGAIKLAKKMIDTIVEE